MKIKFHGDYGYVGTDFCDEYDIPDDIPEEELESWAEKEADEYYQSMCESLTLSYKIIK